ncbi:MAG TPA: hypothetical protein VEC99_13580, partial [Clostridia bacterium]|nr:hypothetical protein [Clostridia bacterium]
MLAKLPDIKNPFGSGTVYDYSAIEDADEFGAVVHNLSFIGVVDVKGSGHGIVYGLETIRAIAAGVIPNQRMRGIVFALDFRTDRLKHLCTAVEKAKGCYEWQGGG